MSYENEVILDIDGHRRDMTGTERFTVAEGQPAVPVLALRQPGDQRFCTDLLCEHWWDDGKQRQPIPCGASIGRECLICQIADELQRVGQLHNEPDGLRRFYLGNKSFAMQLVDLRDHVVLINALTSAAQTQNAAAQQKALADLHAVIMREPIKVWNLSRSVYNDIVGAMVTYSRQNGGTFEDPTRPSRARLLWVSKQRGAGGGMARYKAEWGWQLAIPLPEALWEGDRVKTTAQLHDEFVKRLGSWPTTRIRELLVGCGIHVPMLGAIPGTATSVPAACPAPALPASPIPAPAPAPAAMPQAPGATTSAGRLDCFGQQYSFQNPRCQQCPQALACMEAIKQRVAQPTAPATVQAVTPPQAPAPAAITVPEAAAPPPADAAVDAVEAQVADILAQATGGGADGGQAK